jgi:hypothetical protein
MATTCSSGLNNLLSNSAVTETTLPSWYSTAQQNIANQAGTAQAAAPQFANTASQNAVNTLTGGNNPFAQGRSAVGQIASGAANPWMTCATTGQVTPNTCTALGGLFAAEKQQLCQILPQTVAPVEAGAIGSGNFGSLRGQTAIDTARGNAFDTLAAQQMQAALQNQQTGVSAGQALGNLGAQCVQTSLTTGAAQMNAPFQQVGNYANLINALNVPGRTTAQTQLSPLNMLGSVGSALTGGAGAACSLLKKLGYSGGLACIFKSGGGGLMCCALTKCTTTGYCKSSCGNLIVCKNDQSCQYSGCVNTPTPGGCTGLPAECLNYGGG